MQVLLRLLHQVSVAVGVGNCYIKVVDNGSGITRDGLVLLGERYATSKFDPLDVMDAGTESFDFHGETLCSISDISLLEIVTKARGRPNGYKKIMKKRKCLFLSISDDRLDAGTTVTARDIFYNQPVRRKHMESSSKVLESIRMSVLRISLIHTNVSFKVMDSESACELLLAGPSRPALSILFSISKVENSGALYRLNISSGALNVSGHVSPPLQNFSLKVIQYIYINSRFICKGPIHKLLNQLAAKFDLLNSSKPTAGSQSVKRNKGQMGPMFILNINCPRSYYDIVASEQSRTSVEFKDWGPVLSCIENGVMNLWTENLSHATFESGRKRRRRQNIPTSIGFDTPQLKKLSENSDNFHAWEECISLRRETSPTVSEVKKHQSGDGFWPDTDHLSRCDRSQSGHRVSKNKNSSCHRNPCCVFYPDCYHFIGYSSDKQEDGVSFSESGDFLQKTDGDTNNMSMSSRTSVDCLALGDDLPINRDLRESYLRRCYFQRSFPHDRTSSADDERPEFETEDSAIQETWVDCDKNIEDEICPVFYGRDVRCNKTPPFRASPMTSYDTREELKFMIRDSMDSSEVFSDIVTDSCKHFLNCTSSQQSSGSRWCPMAAKQIVGAKFPQTLVETHPEFDEDSIHGYLIHREDDDLVGCNSSLKGNWLRQSCSNMNSFVDQKKGIGDYDWDDFENSPSQDPLKTFCGTDSSPLPFFDDKSYSVSPLDHAPLLEHECERPNNRMQERASNRKKSSIRSRSAPPCYKGKKRFFGLSDSSSVSASSRQMISQTQLSTGPSSLNHALLHAENVSLRPRLERTPETIKIQEGISPEEQLTSMETVGNFQETHDPLDSGRKWRKYCLPTAGGHARCHNKDQDTILDISSDSFHLIRDSLVPTTIDKTSLDDAKVLNQVDKKFIAVVAGETLIVIDQHAADERIRLEELRHKVLSGEMKKITYLDAEQEMVLPEIGYQLLHNYEEQIQKWGWICNIHSQSTGPFTGSLDSLHRQATVVKLLAVPCIVGVNLTDSDLLEFLQQLDDTDGSSTIPPSVHRILNSKACRGAIMFGDTLLPSECSLIVEELKQTSLCFQCAHGRPTTVPLVNLAMLHDKISKLGSQKSWHGLRQHKLTIQRAAERLSSAIG
ncbi:DNA mismatch repair protein MLH3 isoform X2 [Henckelia pumila]|uniref:DNA mismatch repair protein MLH3 isoform X2 n=1 Tax=Henckelia pumila TaxID=405737 RepID=UPI003C6E9CD4